MSSDVAVSVLGLGKVYTIRHNQARHTTVGEVIAHKMRHPLERSAREEFRALDDVTFDVKQGEVLGVIGRNGAGKSTLLKILSRITAPSTGEVRIFGRVGALLEVGTGFHPELTGRENIYLNGAILGMRRRLIDRRFEEIVDFAGVEQFLDTPVKRYSSGMYVRLAFAVAASLDTDVLLVDEVLAVGDTDFQKRSLGRMESLAASGRAVVVVSHSMSTVARLCTTVVLLADGRVESIGPARDVVDTYLNWRSPASAWDWCPRAPVGDERAQLSRASLTAKPYGDHGVDIRHPIEIAIEFDVLASSEVGLPLVSLMFRSPGGELAFASNNHEATRLARSGVGRYRSKCTVPGNFLSEGPHSVSAMLNSDGWVHAAVDDLLSFTVIDPGLGDSVRGDYQGDWGGVVRPRLPWALERVAESGPT